MKLTLHTLLLLLIGISYIVLADRLAGVPLAVTLMLLRRPIGLMNLSEIVIAYVLLLYLIAYCWLKPLHPDQ